MNRPCVVLARPMNQADPSLARDKGGYLFREVLSGLVDQGLASEVVLAVPDYVPPEIMDVLASWGFAVAPGPDAPQERLAKVMADRGLDHCLALTPYGCLIDGRALEAAWSGVASGNVDAVFTGDVVAPRSFAVLNRKAAETLAQAVSEPLPPFMFRSRLEAVRGADGEPACRVMELDGLDSASEEFLWATLFAGGAAALPPDILSAFLRGRDRADWFSRRQFTRLLSEVSGVRDFIPLEKALAAVAGDDSRGAAAKLASNVHFLRALVPHMPERGGRFLEIGCHDRPLLACLAMNRFDEGVAVEPYVYSEPGVAQARELARVLSECAPAMVPLDTARTARGDFSGLAVRRAEVRDLNLAPESVDFCWSKVVLEHVADPESLSRELYRVLRPGAAMVHRIDFRDHGRDRDAVYINFEFLAHSREQWAAMDQETNLWRVNDFVNLWRKLGFEVEVLERFTRVVEPETVHPCWADYDPEDLYCYDALIKAVKPAART